MKQDLEEHYEKIILFINSNEFFWLRDLRKHMGANNANHFNLANNRISAAINSLKKKNIIRCCLILKGERKYMRNTIAKREDI